MRKTTFLAAALVLLLQGCGPSPEALLVKAKAQIDKKDYKLAIVSLKSALSEHPDLLEARFLFGQALVESGNYAAGALELAKAMDLGYSQADVVPALARALLLQGEYKQVTDSYSKTELKPADAAAALKTTVATAFARQGRADLAVVAADEALRQKPKFAPALTLQAVLAADKGDIAGALMTLDDVLTADPKNRDAWQAKGVILLELKSDRAAASVAFNRAIAIDDQFMPAYTSLVAIALADGNVPAMLALVQQVKKILPQHPQTQFLTAQAALLQQHYAQAREITLQLIKRAPENARLLQFAGTIEFDANALPQAEVYLSKSIRLTPSLSGARRLLAKTYLRMGESDRALSTLKPLLEDPQVDSESLALAAEAHLSAGDGQKAEMLYQRAAKLSPGNTKVRTALALLDLAKGSSATAFAALESVAAADQTGYADMALISARIRRKEYDAALVAIDALAKKQAKRPMPANLKGQVLLAKRDRTGARAAFELALAVDPAYFPAAGNLANMDIQDKHPEQARARFDAILRSDPKNAAALLAQADLTAATGGKATDRESLVRKAVTLNPFDPKPRLAMIQHYTSIGDTKAALNEAQAALAALPGQLDILEALGATQLHAGQAQQAVSTFTKFAAGMPRSPQPYIWLANANLALKDYKAAVVSLSRALDLQPSMLRAQRMLIRIAMEERRFADALKIAKTVQHERSKEEVGYLLEGDIESQRLHWDAALAAYRQGLQRVQTSEGGVKIYATLIAAGRQAEADRFKATWLREHDKDIAFRFYLGDAEQARRNFAAAEGAYLEVLKIEPNHGLALNNLAYVTLMQGKPGALAMATKAYEQMPNLPEFMDTLALAQIAEGRAKEAIVLLNRAIELRPADNRFRLTLAKAYLGAGDKSSAKAELVKLTAPGTKFPGSGEAAKLLKVLSE